MTNARPMARRLLERMLGRFRLDTWSLRWRRHDVIVLGYHNVVADGAPVRGDSSLHLPMAAFRAQVAELQRTHSVVALADLFHASSPGRPRAIITFDDAYQGALTRALPLLAELGLPATVFVAPGLMGRETWWDIASSRGVLTPHRREQALSQGCGRTDGVLDLFGIRAVPGEASERIGTEAELAAAAALPGVTLGSHSWSHPNLAALERAELQDELQRPLAWLRQRFGNVVDWLSYPYGLNTLETQLAAAATGYEAALRVDGGWLGSGKAPSRFGIPRLNVPAGMSLEGFRLRVAGAWPT